MQSQWRQSDLSRQLAIQFRPCYPQARQWPGHVQICAGVASTLGRAAALSRENLRRLLPVGAAAGMRPGVGGLITGILAAVVLASLNKNGITGGGYNTLSEAISGSIAIRMLLILCAFKLVATVFSYASGGAGGIFAPALFIGGMLGGVFGYIDRFALQHGSSDLGAIALVGMGAVFAGIIRAPITSVLIIFEMTGRYGLILPLMISNMTAFALARHFRPIPIYEALLQQDRIYLPHRGARVSHALEQLRVGSAMTRDPVTVSATASVAEALRQVENDGFSTYPVIENGHTFNYDRHCSGACQGSDGCGGCRWD